MNNIKVNLSYYGKLDFIGTADLPIRPIKDDRIIYGGKTFIVKAVYIFSTGEVSIAVLDFTFWNNLFY